MRNREQINVTERFTYILQQYTEELAAAIEVEGMDLTDPHDLNILFFKGTLFSDFVNDLREVVWDVADEFNEAVDDAARAIPRLDIT